MNQEDYPNLVAMSAALSRAFSLFETTRRLACKHVGWSHELPFPGVTSIKRGGLWVILTSDCQRCHGGYVGLPKSSYLLWKGYLPVQCDHGGTILDLLVDPEKQSALDSMVLMPTRVVAVSPAGASVSSGGETTSAKLQGYIARVKARAEEASNHLMAYINVAEHSPAPSYFPELQVDYLRDRLALVADRTEGILEALNTQLQARLRVEQELEPPPVPPALDQSTPARGEEESQDVVLEDDRRSDNN